MHKRLFNRFSIAALNRIYPSATLESRKGLRGCLEDIGPAGIRGWLLDCAACDTHLKVDAYLDGNLLGSGHAVRHRPDISELLGRPIDCEFLIPWETVVLPPELETSDPNREVRLRVVAAASGRELHSLDDSVHTIDEILDYAEAAIAALPQDGNREHDLHSVVAADELPPRGDNDVKAIAFFLPEFHPIAENDLWWGKGFTEWTNVTRASPQFTGHHQPQLPGELGFYDLRLDEVREQQASLAREHGIHGFCYYYYWFQGRRILEQPLQRMLDTGRPDFPFCICWANEHWTRRGDGRDTDVLLKQEHNEGTDLAFIHDVLPILKDPRYIRVQGAPLLLVYRVSLLPDPVKTTAGWRRACKEAGLEAIHLCAVETPGLTDPNAIGFDSAVQFPPHRMQACPAEELVQDLSPDFKGRLHDYEWTVADEINAPAAPYRRFRGVMTGWDNTARRGTAANIFVNSSPQAYEVWLRGIVDATKRDLPAGERFLFINAWNEWAEGAHLEPDLRFGRAYLEATRRALTGTSDWQTLVNYASRRGELSGAVLAEWLRDVGAVLKRQELSCQHLLRSQPNG